MLLATPEVKWMVQPCILENSALSSTTADQCKVGKNLVTYDPSQEDGEPRNQVIQQPIQCYILLSNILFVSSGRTDHIPGSLLKPYSREQRRSVAGKVGLG